MSDMLSPATVDALLSAIDDKPQKPDPLEGRQVRTYDFKRALRFSQDHIRILTRIHENYARLMTTYSSAQLRSIVQASVESVDQMSFEEFVKSLTDQSILSLFIAKPLSGQMVLEVSPDLAFAMLDRMLGGMGLQPDKLSHLTEIETMVMERIFSKILESFQDAWNSVLKLNTELKELEVNPHFLQIVSPNETVVTVTINVSVGDVEGTIRVCLPHVVLEPIMPRLSAHHWLSNQKKDPEPLESEALQKRLRKTDLTIVAELGNSEVTIEEFLNLEIGDVIRLNENVSDPLTVKVDDQEKFQGYPGTSKGRMAIQITEVKEEEDRSNDG
ncbi:flagellar motor switch protein FliM [Guptibacillus algicola]|uniref:flagellar motor switch protein FliM n=1 Tax=Guptibacillus algicola TaxID=225844 RepID=UPI001CD702E9|nr:flagellar motor switch protein FliM [Alkalihalobacillus algicola]MCA0988917.1 flagellar motor switch protein FliM [Alkalihalobacillus algicola]